MTVPLAEKTGRSFESPFAARMATMSEPMVVGYGDTFAELDLAALVRHHEQSGCLATVVAAAIANPFGLVEWNGEGRVTRFNEKPVLNHYIGYLVLSPRVFEVTREC